MQYAALFTPAEEGGFVVTFPDVEGAVTQGDDEREAVEMAQDALATMLDWHIRNGKDIPAARKRGRRYRMIDLPAIVALKIELYNAFRASGVTKTEFAAKLGIPKANVDGYFSFGNHTRLDQLEAAFAALGRRLEVSVSKAA